jgi:hypothetical protein
MTLSLSPSEEFICMRIYTHIYISFNLSRLENKQLRKSFDLTAFQEKGSLFLRPSLIILLQQKRILLCFVSITRQTTEKNALHLHITNPITSCTTLSSRSFKLILNLFIILLADATYNKKNSFLLQYGLYGHSTSLA